MESHEKQGNLTSDKVGLPSKIADPKPLNTNGKGLFKCDGRTRGAKRYKNLVTSLQAVSPLKTGPAKSALITQAGALIIAYETLTLELISGKAVGDKLVRTSNVLNRVLNNLGIIDWNDPKESVTPNLDRLRDPNTWKEK